MSGPYGADVAPELTGSVPVPAYVMEWPYYVRPVEYPEGGYGTETLCGQCEAELYRSSRGSAETDLSELAHTIGQHAKVCPGLTAGRQ